MLIKKIELKNWGPHKSLKADLLTNVVGIIGGNGRGKSNLLQAIDYALNGNLNKQNKELYIYNFGKEDGATKASVHLEFTKDGKDGVIDRSITKTSSTRKLVWDGKEYTSDADVSAQMTRILGADKSAMANAIFIKQGCLATLVKGTPSERLAIFQKLMNLAFLDSRSNDLKNKIDKLKQGITDHRPTLDLLAKQIAEAGEEIAKISSEMPYNPDEDIKAIRTALSYAESQAVLRNQVSTARGKLLQAESALAAQLRGDSVTQLTEDLKAVQLQETAANSVLAHKEDLVKLQTRLDYLESHRASMAADIAAYSKDILSAQEIELIKSSKAAAEQKLEECKAYYKLQTKLLRAKSELHAAEEILRAEEFAANENEKILRQKLAAAEDEISIREHKAGLISVRLAYLQNSTNVEDVCPVCGQHMRVLTAQERSVAELDTLQEEGENNEKLHALRRQVESVTLQQELARDKVMRAMMNVDRIKNSMNVLKEDTPRPEGYPDCSASLQAEISDMQNKLNASLAASDSKYLTESRLADVQRDCEHVRNNLQELQRKIASEADISIDKAEEIRAKRAALSTRIDELRPYMAAADRANVILKTLQDELDELSSTINNCDAVDYCLEELQLEFTPEYLKNALELAEKAQCKYIETATKLSSAKSQLKAALSTQASVQEKVAAEKERLELIDNLELVRRVTDKNGLPLAYMNGVFDSITSIVQDLLAKMGANFTVIKDEERPCSFRFIRTDNSTGYSMPQEMLSGGQAIRLSLALLVACQQLILPEVGLLVLDEPSSHMDAEGVDSLKELFLQMTAIFRSSDTQLIVVDHNPTLTAALEKVIEL